MDALLGFPENNKLFKAYFSFQKGNFKIEKINNLLLFEDVLN